VRKGDWDRLHEKFDCVSNFKDKPLNEDRVRVRERGVSTLQMQKLQ